MLRYVLFLSLLVVVFGQQSPTTNYTYSLTVGVNGKLYWNLVNGTHIQLEIHMQTTGWIGFGISPTAGMTNADIYVGWVQDGMGHITDRHATANIFPPKDTQQDVELLASSECNGWTMLKFIRQLAACEANFDRAITEDTLKIIWAYGTTDPTGTDILAANYHGIQNRGTQNFIPLQAIPTAQLAPVVGETLFTFDLVNSNFAVPAMDTYYSCRMLAFPTLTSKHHIVKMEPIITAGNTLNVHHLVLYTCSQQTLQNPSLLGTTRQCYVNLPTDFQTCQSPYMAWAVGGQSFALPKEAGFSLGSTGDPKYVMLEIHYDNPALSTTIMDSSGLKMSYTPNLRTHDAAMMQVGHTVSGFNHLIPPNATAFNSYGECSQNCLESSLTAASRTSFTVFATILHSHLLGRAIALKHLTGGTEHKPIAVDNTYDFNFQENRYLPDYRVVQSGDSLQVVCTYNSVGKTGFAWGGLGTVNEMCMAFVFYYPQLPVALCDTAPQIDLLLSHLGYNINDLTFPSSNLAYSSLSDVTINSGAESGMTVIQSLNSKSWDNVNGNALSEAMKVATRRQSCTRNRVSPAGATTNVEAPVITTPYVPSQLTCQPVTSPTLSSAVQSCTVNNAGVGTTALSPYVGIYISLLALISFIFLA